MHPEWGWHTVASITWGNFYVPKLRSPASPSPGTINLKQPIQHRCESIEKKDLLAVSILLS